MRSKFAYYGGTWIPLLILGVTVLTYIYARLVGLTWERPAVYVFAAVALIFGVYVLGSGIWSDEMTGRKARFYPVALLWTGVSIFLQVIGLALGSYALVTGRHIVSEAVSFSFIVAGVLSIGVLSFVSFYGGRKEILDAPTDPVPLRGVFRWLRRRWR